MATYNNVITNVSGSVGIGTTNATSRLTILGSSTNLAEPILTVKPGSAQATATAILDIQNSAGTSLLFVTGSGRVGILASAPSYPLDVGGTSRFSGIAYYDSSESINLYGIRGRFTGEAMHLYNKVAVGYPSGWGGDVSVTPTYGLSTYGGAVFAYNQGTVGVGTSTVSAKLHVQGSTTTSTPTVLIKETQAMANAVATLDVQNSAGTSLFFVSGSGIVSLAGTTHYGNGKLQIINGDTSSGGQVISQISLQYFGGGYSHHIQSLHDTATGDGNSIRFHLNTSSTAGGSTTVGTGNALAYAMGYSTHRWNTGGSERMRIDGSGNVGIGTTNTNSNKVAISGGNLSVTGSALPGDNGTSYDLGSTSYKWRTLFANNISGSLTQTGATAGSIFFAGGNSQLQQNNNTLFWDNSNTSLGIGTSVPFAGGGLELAKGFFRHNNIYTTVVITGLGGPATYADANRYEVARLGIDYNDWNTVGVFEIEVLERYWSSGFKKKYYVWYGYTSNSGVYLAEVGGSGNAASPNDQFQVAIGAEVTVTGDQRYIPVYVDVSYYTTVDVVIRTNRTLTTTNPPPIGYAYINSAPGATATGAGITLLRKVFINNAYGYDSFFQYANVGIGTTSTNGNRLSVNGVASISGSVLPGDNGTSYDLGSTSYKWRTLHAVNISGSLTPAGATAGSVFFAGASGQIQQDNSNFFWDDTNNRLGIGTNTSLSYPLTVVGPSSTTTVAYLKSPDTSGAALFFGDSSGILGQLYVTSTGTWLDYNTALSLRSGYGGTTRFLISSTGVVGVGTSTTVGNRIVLGGVGSATSYVKANETAFQVGNIFAGSLSLLTADTERVLIDSSGNVSLRQNSNASNTSVSLNTTVQNAMTLDSSGNLGVGRTSIAASATGQTIEASGCVITGGPLNSHQTSRGVFEYNTNIVAIRAYGATTGTGQIQLKTGGGGGNADLVAMTLDSSGHALPGADNARDLGSAGTRWRTLFAVNISGSLTPTGATAGSVFFAGASGQIQQDNSNLFWDDTNNRLGIGTNSPQQILHLSSIASAKVRISADTDNLTESDVGGIEITQDGGVSTSYLGLDDSNNLVISANSTTSPNIYLSTRSDGTSYAASTDGKVVVTNTGLVGIGSLANLTARLTVTSSSPESIDILVGRVYSNSNPNTGSINFISPFGVGTRGTHDYGAIVVKGNPATNDGGSAILDLKVGGASSAGTDTSVFMRAEAIGGATWGADMVSIYTRTTRGLVVSGSSANVGIGTSSPSYPLHVYRSGLADGSTNTHLLLDGKFAAAGIDSNDMIGISSRLENSGGGSQTTFNIGFSYQAGANAILLQPSSGKVGIGTNNPLVTLAVAGRIYAHDTFGTYTNYGWRGNFYNVAQGKGVAISYDSDSNGHLIQGLASGGNGDLGLNYYGGNVVVGATAASNGLLTVYKVGTGNVELLTLKTTYPTDSTYKALAWRDGTNITGQIDTRYDNITVDMVFGSLYNAGYNVTERMRIKGNGNIGIGTSTFTARLFVSGSSTASTPTMIVREGVVSPTGGALTFEVENSAGATLFSVSGSGNVGVGTSNASGKFEVVGTSGSLMLVTDSLSGSLFSVNDVTGLPIFEVFSDDTVVAGAVGTNALVVTGSRVGVGTNGPSTNLHVVGTNSSVRVQNSAATAKYVQLRSDSANSYLEHTGGPGDALRLSNGAAGVIDFYVNGSERMKIDSSGNVGIGTNTANSNRVAISGGNLSVTGSVLPGDNGSSYDLGSTSYKWRTLYAVNISGSLTPTGATAGSVFFAGASGQIQQDNANLFWDDTNNRLGIGTSTLSEKLHVVSNASYAAIAVGNGTNASYFGYANSSGNYNVYALAGDAIVRGFNGVSIAGNNGAAGGICINSSNNVGINTTSILAKLHVSGTTMMTDYVGIGPNINSIVKLYVTSPDTLSTNYSGLFTDSGGIQIAAFMNDKTVRFANNAVRIDGPSGNVGIGTTNTNSNRVAISGGNLSVTGSVLPGVTTTYDLGSTSYRWNNIYGANIYPGSSAFTAGSVVFAGTSGVLAQNNANLFWDNSNISLGIGTSNPGSYGKFQVVGSNPVISFAHDTGGSVFGGVIRMVPTNGSNYVQSGGSYSNDSAAPLIFSTINGVTEWMRIDSSGRVGIGTATISNKLAIYGTAQDQIYIRGTSTNRAGIKIDNTANQQSQILFQDGGTDKWQLGKQTDNTFFVYDGTATKNIIQGTYRALNRSDLGLVPYQDGRVGIGTDPAEFGKLEIYATGSLQGIYQSDGTRWLRILAGTSTSGAYNSIVSANDYSLIFSGSKATNTPGLVLAPWDGAGATSGLKIDPSGNVGIGTTSMSRKLVVHGSDALINGVAVGTGNNSTDTYNTAVGDSANGALTTGSGNTAVGRAALITVSTGNNNVAVGSSALQSQTASDATAVGTSALWQSTATGNTAVGYNALSSITANSGSVAVGYEALKDATGSNNTALGWWAGRLISTGTLNVAIGPNALRTATTTSGNVAVGSRALELNTGSSNTSIGGSAGYRLTTGSQNVVVGAIALAASTSASYNTAIGVASLATCTGNYNVALGHSSGISMTSGEYNAILGSYSGNNASLNMSTSSRNVVLSDGEGNIRARFDYTGAVGIGTASPVPGYTVTVTSGSTANGYDLDSKMYLLSAALEKEAGYYMTALTRSAHFRVSMATTGVRLGSSTSDPLYLQTNNTTALVIDTSQNVGIGTESTGGEALRVYRSSGATTGLYSNTGNATIIASGYNSTTAVTAALEVSNTVASIGAVTNHPLRLLTNSTEAMRINTSQNVGIGTTSPGSKLHVYSAGPTEIYVESTTNTERSNIKFITNGNDWEIGARGSSGNPNNSFYVYDNAASAYRAVINSSGYVGIGTTNPSALLHVHGETWIYNSPYGGYSHLSYGTTGDNYISSGNDGSILVGATYIRGKSIGGSSIDIAKFTVSNSLPRVGIGTNASFYLQIGADSAAKTNGGSWSSPSDFRLKKDIVDLTGSLDLLLSLKGKRFVWRTNNEEAVGFIAQETESLFPNWVKTVEISDDSDEAPYIEDKKMKVFNVGNDFYAYCVEAMRDLKNENDSLKTEIQSLKDQISSILTMLSNK